MICTQHDPVACNVITAGCDSWYVVTVDVLEMSFTGIDTGIDTGAALVGDADEAVEDTAGGVAAAEAARWVGVEGWLGEPPRSTVPITATRAAAAAIPTAAVAVVRRDTG